MALTMKYSVCLVVLFLLAIQASPWNRGKGQHRTFSDLLRLPSNHNPWHKAAAAVTADAEDKLKEGYVDENDIMEKRARSFADLLRFPQGHNPWRRVPDEN